MVIFFGELVVLLRGLVLVGKLGFIVSERIVRAGPTILYLSRPNFLVFFWFRVVFCLEVV